MKKYQTILFIFLLSFTFCSEETPEEQEEINPCSGNLPENSVCLRLSTDANFANAALNYFELTRVEIEGNRVLDPLMEVYYDADDNEYNFVFAEGYSVSDLKEYPAQFSFLNNYDQFVSVIVSGEKMIESGVRLDSNDVLVSFASSPGSSVVYAGGALFNARGGNGDITSLANGEGDFMEGVFTLSFSTWDGNGFDETNLDADDFFRAEFKFNLERGRDR